MNFSRRDFLQKSTAVATGVPLLMSMDIDYCEAATATPPDLSMGFPENAIRLNWNENTLGPSPLAIKGAIAGLKEGYRYALGSLLAPLLADYHSLDKDWVLMGTGSTELQRLAPATHLNEGGNVVSSLETWAGGLRVAEHMGVDVRRIDLIEEKGFAYDIEGLLNAVDDKTQMFIMVSPNNPTGTSLSYQELKRIADSLPDKVLFVIDEAYADYLPDNWGTGIDLLKAGYKNVLVTRTFSKAHGMAGLRSGYGLGHPDILKRITQFGCGPASTSIVAFGAIQGALNDIGHARQTRSYVERTRKFYQQKCETLNLHSVSGPSPFMMIKTGNRTSEIQQALKNKKILVGNGKSWNVPDYLRVSYGREKENEVFFRTLATLL
ncbi:MAG: aminotransferase class I/II-fold pyridoxal phosphate-dependent enzyme [Gammaproteobacteria bacterium]|nr:aminotransferase class I/II-fold pyridoxal phosphate-dependent enzyme [Gammaproteobacteria bacterium]